MRGTALVTARRWSKRVFFTHPSVTAAVGWLIAWAALLFTGQEYRMRSLYAGWQTLPIDALSRDPFGSVWNLHIQPPLWNLLLGLIGALSPFSPKVSHAGLSVATGMLLAATVCSLVRHLGASVGGALALTALGTLTNQVLAYAFEPRYDTLTMLLVAAFLWSIARTESLGLGRGRWLWPVVFATVLTLTRTIYHPVFLAIVIAALVWRWRRHIDRRQMVVMVAIPLVAVGGWILKNQIVFGVPGVSSWSGMNMLRSVQPAVPPDRLEAMHRAGVVSDVALIGTFSPYEDYASVMPPCTVQTDTPEVLAVDRRPVPPWAQEDSVFSERFGRNFNFYCYIDVYDQAGADTRAIVWYESRSWVKARVWALNNWFETGYLPAPDPSPLWAVDRGLTYTALLAVPHPGLPSRWEESWFWVHATRLSLTIMVATGFVLAGAVRARRGTLNDPVLASQRLTLYATAFVLLWTFLVGVLFELGEQARFRNVVDPVVLAVGGLLFARWVAPKWAALRGRVGASSATDPAG